MRTASKFFLVSKSNSNYTINKLSPHGMSINIKLPLKLMLTQQPFDTCIPRYYTDFCDHAPILDLVHFNTSKSVN